MAYDRNDPRRDWRSSPRSRDDDRFERDHDERGWFERAGENIASWFGDEDAERRRRMEAPERSFGSWRDEDRNRFATDRDRDSARGRAFLGEEDYDRYERSPRWREEGYRRPYTGRSVGSSGSGRDRPESGGYRPMTGDYGRGTNEKLESGASYYGVSGAHDRHYDEWRQRQIDSLDRDYDDYRRENQSRFEDDFSKWRTQRQSKRQMLRDIREHMEVVGSDQEHVGTVDRVAGDRIILAKSDPEAGGAHHSLMCTAIDRVEGDRVFLDMSAEQAKQQWRDESRDRALFEREDQGEAGPGILNRSFSGTY